MFCTKISNKNKGYRLKLKNSLIIMYVMKTNMFLKKNFRVM